MPEVFSETDFASPSLSFSEADFAVKPKKTREQVVASVNAAQAAKPVEQMSGLENVANAAYWPVKVASRMSPLTAIGDALGVMVGYNSLHTPTVAPDAIRAFLSNLAMADASPRQQMPKEGTVGKGIENFTTQLISGLSTPEAVLGMMSGKVPQVGAVGPATTFIPSMVTDIPVATQDLLQSQGAQQTTENALRLASDVLFPLGMAKHALPKVTKSSGIRPVDFRDMEAEAAQFRGYGIKEGVQPSRGQPLDIGVDPRFVLDPQTGQPLVIRAPGLAPLQTEMVPFQPAIVPTKAPVEPSAGKVSFSATAQSEAIPSAGQVGVPEIPLRAVPEQQRLMEGQFVPATEQGRGMQTKAALERGKERRKETGAVFPTGEEGKPLKPEVVKLAPVGSGRKNLLGDPLGTIYRGTAEDVAIYQAQQAKLKALAQEDPKFEKPDSMTRYQEIVAENERVKNKYGGMPPEPPVQGGSIPSEAKGMQTKLKPGQGGESGSIVNPVRLIEPAVEKVKEVTKKLGDFYKGAADKVLPALKFDNKTMLPDFMEKDVANQVFSQPFASEKVLVLGRLMGGKARIRTPQDEAVATWYAERHGVGPAISSALGEQIRGKIDTEFKVDAKGNLNVKPTKGPGQSLKMSDVFEGLQKDLNAYTLTTQQRQAFNTLVKPLADRIGELARKHELIDEMVDEHGNFKPYFPRIVTKHPKLEEKKPTSVFRSRAFSDEKTGWEKGYEYETSVEKRLVSGVNRLYRAMANQRLAKDPILGAKSEAQVKAEIKESFREELGSGAMTQKQIDRIAEGIRTRGQVMQPILIRKIFDPETAKMLNKEFAAEHSNVRRSLATANSAMKALQLGFDVGVGQIQMLPTLYNNPKVWAKAQFDSFRSMVNPQVISEYVRQNKEAVSELAQLGSSVGRMQEMLSGLEKGQPLTKIPGLGPLGEAFGRQFQTALDVAKIELWKSLRDTAPKSEWPKLVRAIETTLLSGRMESAMVPHGKALLERIALLAPSYYRGAVDSIAGLAERGASGKVVRNAMGRFIVGGLFTYYAIAKLTGMEDEEILKRLDPTRTDYLMWSVPQEDGSKINLGFGGIHRSLLRLVGNVTKTSIEHPENWKSLSSEKNPLSRWYRGHAGPTVGTSWDAFSGEDFLGRDTTLGTLVAGRLPLIAQQAVTRKGEAPAKPIEYGASAVGMTATPENFSSRRKREVEEGAQKKFGKSYAELSIGQRKNVETAAEKRLAGVATGTTPERAREMALKRADERLEELKKRLEEETVKWIESNKLQLRNYDTTKEIAGTSVRLTENELKRLQENMVREYQESLSKLQTNSRVISASLPDKQRYVDVHLEIARKKAWAKTRPGKEQLQK